MAVGKNFQVWLSGDLHKKAVKRIAERHKGNEADYLRTLIERDTDPDHVLIQLAEAYWPTAAPRLRTALAEYATAHPGFSQDQALTYCLDALLKAAQANRDLMSPFEVMSLAEKLDYQKRFEEQQVKFNRALEIISERMHAPELLHQLNDPAPGKSRVANRPRPPDNTLRKRGAGPDVDIQKPA